MPALVVEDANDPRIAEYRNVPDGELLRARGVFVAEGRSVVQRLLGSRRFRTRSVLVTQAALGAVADLAAASDVAVYVVPQAVMNGVTGIEMHRGCLAIGERGSPLDAREIAREARRLVVLERLANADNVGGVFRNAAAFGADGVLLDPRSIDPLYRKAIRTSVGAALQVPFARATAWPALLDDMRGDGMTLVGLTPAADAAPIASVARELGDARVALLLGHEGDGLSEDALARCDVRARIPMSQDVDSLNVATAAALGLYELGRLNA